jgi:hypothetical protein
MSFEEHGYAPDINHPWCPFCSFDGTGSEETFCDQVTVVFIKHISVSFKVIPSTSASPSALFKGSSHMLLNHVSKCRKQGRAILRVPHQLTATLTGPS